MSTRMDLIDNGVFGQVVIYCKVWNSTTHTFDLIPADIDSNPPPIYAAARQAAQEQLHMEYKEQVVKY